MKVSVFFARLPETLGVGLTIAVGFLFIPELLALVVEDILGVSVPEDVEVILGV